jgi:hypothetical protein
VTTYTCPDGHASTAGDYCDVCGAPIAPAQTGAAVGAGSGVAPSGPPPLPPSAPPAVGSANPFDLAIGSPAAGAPTADRVCPNCGTGNLPGALYCEDCGYDFTTGQLPRPLSPPSGVAPDTGGMNLPADLLAPDAVPPTDLGPAPAGVPADIHPDAPAGDVDAVEAADAADAGRQTPVGLVPPVTPTSAPGHVEWVAEIWVDPDWYASQDVSEPCPSAGMPSVIPILERSVLIGRLSTSRNIHPQIDLSSDNGVSRRHAQLNSDGQRWWVEDLQSANGTYLGAAGGPLPSNPIAVGQRVELEDGDRVYLGAWTRLVVRRATPEETTLGS